MKKIIILFVALSALFFAITVQAEEKMTIAVLNLKSKDVPKIVVNAVSEIIRNEFTNIANFTVIEREHMDKIFEEQELSMTGAVDTATAVKAGKLLSAKKIVTGEMNSIDKAIVMTIRIVDVESGVSEFSANDKALTIDDVDAVAKKIARDLAHKIVENNKEFFYPISPAGYFLRGAVPGWSQVYAEHPIKGYTFFGFFVASVGFSAYSYYDFVTKKEKYNDLPHGSAQFDKKYNDYNKAADMFNYSLMAIGAVYAIHLVDMIFFSRPDFTAPAEQKQAGLYWDLQIVSTALGDSDEMGVMCGMGVRW